jgi:NADH:ubiquinone oxidoreductase subunit 6 (subunit J)
MAKKRTKNVKKTNKVIWKFPFTKQNYLIFGVGLAVILIGYALMATGVTEEPAIPDGKWNNPMAIIVAPILLIVGYLVIIPYGILKFFGNNNNKAEN